MRLFPILSLVLAIAAFGAAFSGALLSVVALDSPFLRVLGAVVSFAALALALAGIVTASLSISRSRQRGEDTGLPMAGLVASILAFPVTLLVAGTCGLCNACVARQMLSGTMDNSQLDWSMEIHVPDAGADAASSPPSLPPPPINSPTD